MVSDKCYANSYNIVDFYEIAVIAQAAQYTIILCLVSLLYLAWEWTFFEFCLIMEIRVNCDTLQ